MQMTLRIKENGKKSYYIPKEDKSYEIYFSKFDHYQEAQRNRAEPKKKAIKPRQDRADYNPDVQPKKPRPKLQLHFKLHRHLHMHLRLHLYLHVYLHLLVT